MNALLHPTYFPSISHFSAMAKSDLVTFEMEDNYQKQTNRNRTFIYSPNGIQLLNIPIKHSKEIHQKTKDVRIAARMLDAIQLLLKKDKYLQREFAKIKYKMPLT